MRRSCVLVVVGLLALGCGDRQLTLDTGASAEDPGSSTATETDSSPTTETTTDPSSSGPTSSPPPPASETLPNSGFVPHDDGPYQTEGCDPWSQDCIEGEKCVAYASTGGNWDDNKCVPILGEREPGETCTSAGANEATDDCDGEGWCWGADAEETDGGICRPFCDGTADAPICGEGTECLIANNGSINLCLSSCDPLAQNCAEGEGCHWAHSVFLCLETDPGHDVGEPCGYFNSCLPGLGCIPGDFIPDCAGSSCCTSYCDLTDPDSCSQQLETSCMAFFEEGMDSEHPDLGVCIL